ncbi:hypothetical protein ACHAWC_005524 [Mediolabrus comicus]
MKIQSSSVTSSLHAIRN